MSQIKTTTLATNSFASKGIPVNRFNPNEYIAQSTVIARCGTVVELLIRSGITERQAWSVVDRVSFADGPNTCLYFNPKGEPVFSNTMPVDGIELKQSDLNQRVLPTETPLV